MTNLTGKCLCGAVTYEGQGDPTGVHACHCEDCTRFTGGAFLGVAFADGIEFSGPVNWYKSSEWAERGSCKVCGSAMFWRLQDGGYFTVAAGTLDDKSAVAPMEEHIFIDAKPHYYDFADKAPRLTGAEVMARLQEQSDD